MSEEEIDRNLIGTFPASDPPSWTLGVTRADRSTNQEELPPPPEESSSSG